MFVWLFVCAAADVGIRKIPNMVILVGLIAGVLAESRFGGSGAFLVLIRAAATSVFLFPLFRFRMMGAGDVKLMAALVGVMGAYSGVGIIVLGFLAAVPVCMFKLLYHRCLVQRLTYFFAYFRHLFLTKNIRAYHDSERDGYRNTIPFAVFLLMGSFLWWAFLERQR